MTPPTAHPDDATGPHPAPADATGPGATGFDATGPLPTGTTVLEASAGTGKTWTIAGLAARFVAEGTPLGALMMVTFSRAASRELRTRIRERLERTRRVLERALAEARSTASPALADPGAGLLEEAGQPGTAAGQPDAPRLSTGGTGGTGGPGDRAFGDADAVDVLLTTGTTTELELRRHRIQTALADFDAATIATTHEFCQQMLTSLGVLADADPRAVLVEHLDDLTEEVCHDHYLLRFAHEPQGATDELTFAEALTLGRAAVREATLPLVPDDPDPGVRLRVDFAAGVRAEVLRRKRRLRLQTFDDVLTGLRDTLAHPEHGEAARQRLRDRFRVVLVDEFQDTDPVQWQILTDAFAGHATLVLVGDPKQAIYAFRGADVHSYLAAVAAAENVVTLQQNHRSDPAMVRAVGALFEGATLGEQRIRAHPVQPARAESRIRVADGRAPTPLRLRLLPGPERWRGDVAEDVLPDLVAEVRSVLSDGTELYVDQTWRQVRAGDVAVLVRTNRHAEQIRAALSAAGVPAVVNGGRSVHGSPAADAWLTLLEALADPRQRPVRQAALTPLLGWSLADLATAGDHDLAELSRRVKEWARLLETDGVAAVADRLGRQQQLAARLLAAPGGERELTDLRHVAESLHQAQLSGGLGVAGLSSWLRERQAAERQDGDDRARRLESDADAVQILTYHHSKGLQFPVVALPAAWDCFQPPDKGQVLTVHDDTGQRVLDVGGRQGAGRAARFRDHVREQDGEELRQLYVSLTRAQCQVIAWWAVSKNGTSISGLHRMLHRPAGESRPAERYPATRVPAADRFDPRLVRLETVEPGRRLPPPEPAEGSGPLQVRRFERPLDLLWRRTSYTGLTAAAHGHPPATAGVGSDPAVELREDEPAPDPDRTDVSTRPVSPDGPGGTEPTVSPLADFPGGTAFGSLVHELLEHADPQAPDLTAELTALAAHQLGRLPTAGFGADQLAQALLPALHTPLGPLADGLRLVDLPAGDRLAELDFELPLAGGRTPASHATLADVADCLQAHLEPGDPLASYPDRLRDPLLAGEVLRGFLTGSIDAVLRTPADADGVRRHLVVDYKTNWLGPHQDTPLTVEQYHPAAVAEAMMAAHYPLQALLYSVALHRFLTVRLAGYRPETHLGGILYLFVRGMAGPQTPVTDGVPYGVFSWRPPADLVRALSALLAHGPGGSGTGGTGTGGTGTGGTGTGGTGTGGTGTGGTGTGGSDAGGTGRGAA